MLYPEKVLEQDSRLAEWLFMLMGALFAVVAFVQTAWTFVALLIVGAMCIVSIVVYSYLDCRNNPHCTSPAGTQPSAD